MSNLYIMNPDGSLRPTDDVLEWGRWFENPENRRVAEDTIEIAGQKVYVSSVCLGLNHQWGEGEPLVFETMAFLVDKTLTNPIFGMLIEKTWGNELAQRRFATYQECLDFHRGVITELELLHRSLGADMPIPYEWLRNFVQSNPQLEALP